MFPDLARCLRIFAPSSSPPRTLSKTRRSPPSLGSHTDDPGKGSRNQAAQRLQAAQFKRGLLYLCKYYSPSLNYKQLTTAPNPFLRLGIPAPMKAVAWPGLSDGAHPVQVLRGCLTARTGRALQPELCSAGQPPSPTRSTPLPQELCVYTHTYMVAFVYEAVHAHIHIK